MASILKSVRLPSPSGLFGRLKHKKLAEEWGEGNKEPVADGITFYVKYLGSTLVTQPNDQQSTADAIKTIIAMARASGKKLQRVALKVTPRGIFINDLTTNEKQLEFSIYRISYCSADAAYERVVAFIATNANETLECHAFLCTKRKIAEAAALTISQAFSIAFDLWERAREEKAHQGLASSAVEASTGNLESSPSSLKGASSPDRGSQCALIDLNMEGESASETMKKLGFSMDSNLNDSFSRLAESRTHPMFSSTTTLKPEDFQEVTKCVRSQDRDQFLMDQGDDLLLL